MDDCLTFDGEWSRVRLNDADMETLDAIFHRDRSAHCGAWLLHISHPTFDQTLCRRYWPYVVTIEAPGSDAKGGPILFETVLVAGFAALLQLLAILKAGDLVSAEPSED